jgi:hypothetical protein
MEMEYSFDWDWVFEINGKIQFVNGYGPGVRNNRKTKGFPYGFQNPDYVEKYLQAVSCKIEKPPIKIESEDKIMEIFKLSHHSVDE